MAIKANLPPSPKIVQSFYTIKKDPECCHSGSNIYTARYGDYSSVVSGAATSGTVFSAGAVTAAPAVGMISF